VDEFEPLTGIDVYGSDGEKVGKIVSAHDGYIVVEKGFFFPTHYFIPVDAVGAIDGEKAYLTVTKVNALSRGWDIDPADASDPDERIAIDSETK
jgi:hypothetical protein